MAVSPGQLAPFLNVSPICYYFCASSAQMLWWTSKWVNNTFQYKACLLKKGPGEWMEAKWYIKCNVMKCTVLSQSVACSWVCAWVQCFDLTVNLVRTVIPRLICKREGKRDQHFNHWALRLYPFLLLCFFIGVFYCVTVSLGLHPFCAAEN